MKHEQDGATGPASSGTSATRTIPPEIYERLLAAEASLQVPALCDAVTVSSPGASHRAPMSEATDPVTERKPQPPARALTHRGTMIMNLEAILASRAKEEAALAAGAPPFRMSMATTEEAASRTHTLLGVAAVSAPVADAGDVSDSLVVRRALDEMSMIIDVGALQRKIERSSTVELEAIVERLRKSEGLDRAALESAPPPPMPVERLPPPPVLPVFIPSARGSDPDLVWTNGQSSMPPPMPSTRREGRPFVARKRSAAGRWVIGVAGALAAVVGVVGTMRLFEDTRAARAFEPATTEQGATAAAATDTSSDVAPAAGGDEAAAAVDAVAPDAPAAAQIADVNADEPALDDDPELVPPPKAMNARERLRLEEAYVVARAEKALAKGDAAGALAMLSRAEKRFPEKTAALADAREALSIEALATTGRPDEAMDRAVRFDEKFPKSRHKERVAKIAPKLIDAPVETPAAE